MQYGGDFKPEFGLDKAALTVEVQLEGESEVKKLKIGSASDDKNRYATTAVNAGAVFLLREDELKHYLTGPEHFAKPDEKAKEDQEKEAEQKEAEQKEGEQKEVAPAGKEDPGAEPEKAKPEEKAEGKPSEQQAEPSETGPAEKTGQEKEVPAGTEPAPKQKPTGTGGEPGSGAAD